MRERAGALIRVERGFSSVLDRKRLSALHTSPPLLRMPGNRAGRLFAHALAQ
jgi:hypothetical protein